MTLVELRDNRAAVWFQRRALERSQKWKYRRRARNGRWRQRLPRARREPHLAIRRAWAIAHIERFAPAADERMQITAIRVVSAHDRTNLNPEAMALCAEMRIVSMSVVLLVLYFVIRKAEAVRRTRAAA